MAAVISLYHRAWIYDTPQQSPDVWMTLALAAQGTFGTGLVAVTV